MAATTTASTTHPQPSNRQAKPARVSGAGTMIKVVCNMTFNAVLSSPDAILCGEGLPAGLPVCVQMVRQKQQESKSSSKRRKKKDAVYFTVRTRDTSRIVQCFTLWPGPGVVCDHDDVPKSALFVTETAVR
eukprot:CAMPEP_0116028456 /NCGR_PEP_ID=MMETSP0321-20121206/15417_1 /TAXON_ID=163516 /ORGANISM="Leptocylindrus danicus var. danicus, Strain B650" /LENGTH=130 /DNA_ID=CAMNT_0003502369 /DNA_START=70 /DNA_END=459 /DNA_ORIENTATION=-